MHHNDTGAGRVKEVGEISGLPEEDAEFLREWWQKPEDDDKPEDMITTRTYSRPRQSPFWIDTML